MAEPTTTRKTLRREIAAALRGEFFRLYPEGELAVTGTSATTRVVSSSLTQVDDYWNNGFLYMVDGPAAGYERRINDFAHLGTFADFLEPFPYVPVAGNKFEIHERWSATQIHQAINRAIRFVAKDFPESVNDETQILEEDKLSYSLLGLSKRVLTVGSVWVGYHTNSFTVQPSVVGVSGVNIEITLPSGVITSDDQYNGWTVSIYYGTGKNQMTTITDTVLSTNKIVVLDSAFTPNPDTTSKLRLWDANDQQTDWRKLTFLRTDFQEYPNNLYLTRRIPEYEGFNIRLIYTTNAWELTTDADTTKVPSEYLIHEAQSILYDQLTNDNRADSNRYAGLAQYHHQIAMQYRVENQPAVPSSTIFLEDNGSDMSQEDVNPLGWSR